MTFEILIVDDCPDDRYLLRRSLERIDPALRLADAHSVASALEALLALPERGDAVVVFLDVSMPIRGGFDLLEDLRVVLDEAPARTPPRVVMFSSSCDRNDVERAKRFPFVVDYLSKDVDRETLAKTVKRARDTSPTDHAAETIENAAHSY